jgi:sporulation protein YlmC with PRC-barrel domain
MEQPDTRRGGDVKRATYGVFEKIDDHAGPALMGAGALIGDEVCNPAGEALGAITEIVLDMHCARIAYAVLSYGGFLGMGEKLFAVPWKALTLDAENHRFTLDATMEYLKDAPGFDKDRWPNMADRTWAMGVHDFYGTLYDYDLEP